MSPVGGWDNAVAENKEKGKRKKDFSTIQQMPFLPMVLFTVLGK